MTTKHTEDYLEGRQAGLDEALKLLLQMEGRYRHWARNNPGIEGISDSSRGKIDAIETAYRALENQKKNLPK